MADTSQGTGSQSQQGGDGPKFVTEEQFNEQLNRAITSRLREFESSFTKKVGETIKASVDGIAPSLDKMLEERLSALKPADGGKSGKDDPSKVDIENHPAFKGLKKQLEEATSKTQKLADERDTEARKAKDIELRTRLTESLVKNGVDPKYARHAVGVLVDSEKRVRWNEDGTSILYRDDRDGDVDLETGLKGWIKADDAKIYLPPRGTQGSGDRGGGRAATTGAAGKAMTYEDLGNAVLAQSQTMHVPVGR